MKGRHLKEEKREISDRRGGGGGDEGDGGDTRQLGGAACLALACDLWHNDS